MKSQGSHLALRWIPESALWKDSWGMVTNSRRRGRRGPHSPGSRRSFPCCCLIFLRQTVFTWTGLILRRLSCQSPLSSGLDHPPIHSFIQYLSSLNYVAALGYIECKIRPCPCPHGDFSLGGNGNELRNQTKKCTTTCAQAFRRQVSRAENRMSSGDWPHL